MVLPFQRFSSCCLSGANWRPEGWADNHTIWVEQGMPVSSSSQTFELGADRMLDAIVNIAKQEGVDLSGILLKYGGQYAKSNGKKAQSSR